MSDENTDAPPKGGKLKTILKILGFLLVAVLFAAGGFGAGWFYFANPMSPNGDILSLIEKGEEEKVAEEVVLDEQGRPQKQIKPTPEVELFVTSYYTFPDTLTTNLAGSRRFLQLSVGVSTQYDATVITNVETHRLALVSDILGVLADFTEEDAKSKEGRDKLAVDIRNALNKRLEALEGFGGVEDVFFPSFILQ